MMSFLPRGLSVVALLLLGVLTSLGALADWQLDSSRSTVQFMSVKNGGITELHHFKSMHGAITDGAATVSLELDSVETLIPVRNQRVRELLFETVRFPAATLKAVVPDAVSALQVGESIAVQTPVSVNLHGETVPYDAKLQVTRLADQGLMVVLVEPLLVKAADFGLEAGIQTLREVAGLKSISTNVPVSGQFVFSLAVE